MIGEQALDQICAQYDAGQRQEALQALCALRDGADKNDPMLPDTLLALVCAANGLAQYDAARNAAEALLACWQGTPDEVLALRQMAVTERMAGRYGEALAWLEKENALLNASSAPDAGLYRGGNLFERGYIALLQGQWEIAKILLDSSMEAAALTNDAVLAGCAQRALGEWHRAKGDIPAARNAWTSARDQFHAMGDAHAAEEVDKLLEALEREQA